MTVIAMTREMGTRGKDVAAEVASALNLEVVHHELVERHLAERMNLSESTVHRFLEGEASLWERWNIDSRKVSHFTAVEILELARRGNVLIRGWGAGQLLRDVPHVISVRICAPMAERLREMRSRLRIDDDTELPREADRADAGQIRREIERNDDAHDRAVRAHFNMDWQDPKGYNIVLNTACTPVSAASQILIHMARLPEFEETEHSRAVLDGKRLLARVRAAVSDTARRALGGSLEFSVDDGIVTLEGVAVQEVDLTETLEAIRAIDGVRSVVNRIRSIPMVFNA